MAPRVDRVHTTSELPAEADVVVIGGGIGPGAGHLMADLVMGKTPIVDPAPYRYQRLVKP